MHKLRLVAPRFSIGTRVVVNDAIRNPHIGEIGTVLSIRYSRYSITLDKYSVQLDSGLRRDFWDIQLRTDDQTNRISN